jgi:hypothetical protein
VTNVRLQIDFTAVRDVRVAIVEAVVAGDGAAVLVAGRRTVVVAALVAAHEAVVDVR